MAKRGVVCTFIATTNWDKPNKVSYCQHLSFSSVHATLIAFIMFMYQQYTICCGDQSRACYAMCLIYRKVLSLFYITVLHVNW